MALPTASDNAFPSILITEGTEPTAPAAGKQRLYIDSTTHKLKRTDSSGIDVTLEASGAITASPLTQATARILGRTTASTGAIEEITVGSGLTLSAGSLTASGAGLGAWTTYTPAWTSDGTAPAIGNGTLAGRYRLLDTSSMQLIIQFVVGSTSTNGTGNYFFSMPGAYKAKNVGGLPQTGAARLLDSGTAHFSATALIFANGTTISTIVADNTGVRQFGAGAPITLATGDELNINMLLEVE